MGTLKKTNVVSAAPPTEAMYCHNLGWHGGREWNSVEVILQWAAAPCGLRFQPSDALNRPSTREG